MKIKLDEYEQQIEDSLAKGEFTSSSNLDEIKKLFQEAVKNYRELQETKSITLRVKKEDLIKVKAKAKRNGIAYQTLISLLIHQYINGVMDLSL